MSRIINYLIGSAENYNLPQPTSKIHTSPLMNFFISSITKPSSEYNVMLKIQIDVNSTYFAAYEYLILPFLRRCPLLDPHP